MQRHSRPKYFLVNDGRVVESGPGGKISRIPTAVELQTAFRFSRLGAKGTQISDALRLKLAEAMVAPSPEADPESAAPGIPSGFTYLAQFVDHDLTSDKTQLALGQRVSVEDMVQGRSPALDLDSLFGFGPEHPSGAAFYETDGRLKTGTSQGVQAPPGLVSANTDQAGHDLPRAGAAAPGTLADKRAALIPDSRNDENLVVAQLHLAFIHFYNRVHELHSQRYRSSRELFRVARADVVRHYQWMLRTDLLPRIVDPAIVESVFTEGRRFIDLPPGSEGPFPAAQPGDAPTMPIEFSVACYRLGHSMVRDTYEWNRVFNSDGGLAPATLDLLFRFTGTSGNLTPTGDVNDPESGTGLVLPSNWIADWRRFFRFDEAGRADLVPGDAEFNLAKRLDTVIANPLSTLPLGALPARGQAAPPAVQLNLAFRNLERAAMVELATGPQLAKDMGLTPLTEDQIVNGGGGAKLDLTDDERADLIANTPLWFYILREAETNPAGAGRLTGVGGTIVAEVFHRAMEGSLDSIVKDPQWRPTLPSHEKGSFRMTDLLLLAFDGRAGRLNPLGEGPLPAPPAPAAPAGQASGPTPAATI